MVGTVRRTVNGGTNWIYRFAGNEDEVPPELIQLDVYECCLEHLSKLATYVLAFADASPFYSCYRRVLTREGLKTLGLELSDIVQFLGFPRVWAEVADIPEENIRILLQKQFDGVDFDTIRRIAGYELDRETFTATPSDRLSDSLTRAIVDIIEARQK